MSPMLRAKLEELASTFADQVIHTMRGLSLDELLAMMSGDRRSAPRATATRRGPSAPRERRSEEDIAALATKIVALVKTKDTGLRAEQIRATLGIEKKHWALPLAKALAEKKLRKIGAKRATTYFAT